MLYRILRIFAVPLMRVLFRMEVKGVGYIPRQGGFILASNHLSYLDPVVLGAACPRTLSFMARHDLFSNPWFSWLITMLGAFPVRRDSADASALKEAMLRVKNGQVLVVFPEGRRRGFNEAGEKPLPGVGFLATKLAIPVIPAFISGSEKALPKDTKFIRPHKISVRFGKQILIERRMPYQDAAHLIMENIRHLAC